MGEQFNPDVELDVVIDGGQRVESVAGGTLHIDDHGFLNILNSKGEVVGIFAKFDHVVTKPAKKE